MAQIPQRPIQCLPEHVVNQIAAGEVIQRPVNALKEMVENSIDAGATQINVIVKDGGNKLLQIQDNGHGVQVEDLPLLCQRHATSKLRQYEDLHSIGTLGFRGEALASISFVANVTVTTMTHGASHGYKATYMDGKVDPAGPKPCAAVQGTTILVENLFYNSITRKKALRNSGEEYARILDMLGAYAIFKAGVGMLCKKQGETRPDVHVLQGASQIDNIRAIHGADVARNLVPLALQVGGDPAKASASTLDEPVFDAKGYISSADYNGKKTVMLLFINGRPVECQVLKRALEATYAATLPKASKPFVFLDVRLPGHHVDVNVHPTKREVAFLHQSEIIGRLCSAAEQLLLGSNTQRTYIQTQLAGPGSAHAGAAQAATSLAAGDEALPSQPGRAPAPNRYVRTDSRAQTLDRFLRSASSGQPSPRGDPPNGQEIEPRLSDQRDAASSGRWLAPEPAQGEGPAAGAEGDRMPGDVAELMDLTRDRFGAAALGRDAGFAAAATAALGAPRRRGGRGAVGSARPAGWSNADPDCAPPPEPGPIAAEPAQRGAPARGSDLASVAELLAEVDGNQHLGLTDILRGHVYVGLADPTRALLQSGTVLYLVDVHTLSRDLFYQLVLRQWETVGRIWLDPPPALAALAMLALQHAELGGRSPPSPGPPNAELAELITRALASKRDLLRMHIALDIDDQGRLAAIPLLLDGHRPDLDRLPWLVLALAQDVEWRREKPCFRSLAEALADFYSVQAPIQGEVGGEAVSKQAPSQQPLADATGSSKLSEAAEGAASPSLTSMQSAREWEIEHAIFPAFRSILKPQRPRATDGTIVELTRLERLYRIFERC